VISPYNPEFVDIASRLQPPSRALAGHRALGRDVLSRVFYSSRISLIAGFSVVVISAVFGTVLQGAIAAYARAASKKLLMRLTDLVLCFPPIIWRWPSPPRWASAPPHDHRDADRVVANTAPCTEPGAGPARAGIRRGCARLGFGHRPILFRHVVPNAVALIVMVTLDLGNAILVLRA
jgi:peptide/nickel transport system permease protein